MQPTRTQKKGQNSFTAYVMGPVLQCEVTLLLGINRVTEPRSVVLQAYPTKPNKPHQGQSQLHGCKGELVQLLSAS